MLSSPTQAMRIPALLEASVTLALFRTEGEDLASIDTNPPTLAKVTASDVVRWRATE